MLRGPYLVARALVFYKLAELQAIIWDGVLTDFALSQVSSLQCMHSSLFSHYEVIPVIRIKYADSRRQT